jgi:hypothetical protein
MAESPEKSVKLTEYASKLDTVYLSSLVQKLDNYSVPGETEQVNDRGLFREGVLALDAMEFSEVEDKSSWIQNLENGLSVAAAREFNSAADALEKRGELPVGVPELKSAVKSLGQLNDMYTDDDPALYVDTQTGDFASAYDWDEAESGKILAYEIKKYRFIDAKGTHFAFIYRHTHQLSNNLELINRRATQDPEALSELDSVRLTDGGSAADFKRYFQQKIDSAVTQIHTRVTDELDKENLGGYIRQFYTPEKLTESLTPAE